LSELVELDTNIKELAYLDKKIYKDCLLFANSAAFLCITVLGAMPSMPLRD